MALFNKYFFDYEINSDFFKITWNKNSKKITEKEFFIELERLAKLIEKHKPKKILGNIQELGHLLVDEGVGKYMKIMIPAYKNSNLQKLGVVVGEDLFKQLFVEHLFENAMKIHNFKGNFFKTPEEALKWINEN
ncbi:MAG: hypothetical protein JXR68_02790 [Bacteroidales bacterium]|nr:hypothetical protein [Bacteroidales bacterium]